MKTFCFLALLFLICLQPGELLVQIRVNAKDYKLLISRGKSNLKMQNPNQFDGEDRPFLPKLPQTSESKSSRSFPPPWLPAFGTACLGGFMFGMDIGSSSSVLRILGSGETDFGQLSALQLGQVASASLLGAILSSAAIAVIGDERVGRRLELRSAAWLFLAGSLIQSLATTLPLELFGRVIFGLGIGVAMHAAPLFIGETAPDEQRGRLISFKEAAIVLGIVSGYVSGAIFGVDENWRAVFLSALPFEVAMLMGTAVVCESPRWLALRGRKEEAVDVLRGLQSIEEIAAKEKVDRMVCLSNETGKQAQLSELFSSPYSRRALTIGLGLVLFQQLSGQPSVLYFANRIFEQAGLGFQAAVAVGLFKLLMTAASASLVENPRFGRKALLLIGNTGITISLLLLSFFYSHPAEIIEGAGIMSQLGIIGAMFLFVGAYQIGFGPITWLVLSEIFPLRVRSAAVSIGTLTNFASNLLVALTFEAERQLLGEPALFLQFAIIALFSVVFTLYYVFETQGLSLEDIEVKLRAEVDKS